MKKEQDILTKVKEMRKFYFDKQTKIYYQNEQKLISQQDQFNDLQMNRKQMSSKLAAKLVYR